MHLDLHSLSLAFLDLPPWSVAIIVPVASLVFVGVLIVSGMYFHNRRREMWHQTARLALEKGQPLPPSFEGFGPSDAPAANVRQARWRGYLISGLINLGIGAGLFLALSQIPGTAFNVGYFGCIPGFIGIALLIGAVIEAIASRK